MMHKLPKKWEEEIKNIVAQMESEQKNPTVYMVSNALAKKGLSIKTARDYVFIAVRDKLIVKHSFNLSLK